MSKCAREDQIKQQQLILLPIGLLHTKLKERKRRGRIKHRRYSTKVGNETPKEKGFSENADSKEIQNQNESKNESYSQHEDVSSITALAGVESSDECESSQSSSISLRDQNTFDDDYKKAVSVVRKKEQPSLESASFRPIISANSSGQEYYLNLIQQTLFTIGEPVQWDPFFEFQRTDYPNPIISSITFWRKILYNWFKICEDFSDYSSTMLREYWIKPFSFISGGK